jgi:phage-related protein
MKFRIISNRGGESLPAKPKPVVFLAKTRDWLRAFPDKAKQQAGNELNELQQGRLPSDWKPMPNVGAGALEIRVHKPHEHRVICIAKFPEAIYVLNAFEKKTQKTPKKELDLARRSYAEIKNIQKQRNKTEL